MAYKDTPYFTAGRASDLTGSDRVLYRALEILPGALAWGTILGTFVLSYFVPVWAAVFIIIFDLYWLLKTVYLSIHLRHNWKRMKYMMSLDWDHMLENLKYGHIWHMVILPFYNEPLPVVEKSLEALLSSDVDRQRLIVVLAGEERVREHAEGVFKALESKYPSRFGKYLTTIHPQGVPGEMPGKGSNIAYAAEEARKLVLDAGRIDYADVIVSAFDIDTVVYPQYFKCLTWNFLTHPDPYKVSFQPVPLFNNNVWHVPAVSRVVAFSSTFWQMIQQERPEKLATFSSHSLSFKALYEGGYWQKNIVSEDSRIFWNLFVARDGDYSVVPISYPVSMDANLSPTFFATMKAIYKQHRRWGWGVENVPYILFAFIKNKNIPLRKRISMGFVQLEGFWSLSTNPLMIFLLGWLPLTIGGMEFKTTVLSYNLPIITRDLMILSMCGLFLSAAISWSLLPKRPEGYGKRHSLFMVLQWLLIPVTITVFGAIPGLEAQTRLMLGKYMGFWVTPKFQKPAGK